MYRVPNARPANAADHTREARFPSSRNRSRRSRARSVNRTKGASETPYHAHRANGRDNAAATGVHARRNGDARQRRAYPPTTRTASAKKAAFNQWTRDRRSRPKRCPTARTTG